MSTIKVYIEEIENDRIRDFIEETVPERLAEEIESLLTVLIIDDLIGLKTHYGAREISKIKIRIGEKDHTLNLFTSIRTKFGLNTIIGRPDIEYVDDEDEADFVIEADEDTIEQIARECIGQDYYDVDVDYPYTYDDEEYDDDEYNDAYYEALNELQEERIADFDYYNDLYASEIVNITPKINLTELISRFFVLENEEEVKTKEIILSLLNNIEGLNLNDNLDAFETGSDDKWNMEFYVDGEDIFSIIERTSSENITPEEKKKIDYLCRTWELGFNTSFKISCDEKDDVSFANDLQLHHGLIEDQVNRQARDIIDGVYSQIRSGQNSHLEFDFEEISYEYSLENRFSEVPLSHLIVRKSPIVSYNKSSKMVKLSSKTLNVLGEELKLNIKLDCKLPFHIYDTGIKSISFENIDVYNIESNQSEIIGLLSEQRMIDESFRFSFLPEEFDEILSSNWSELFNYLSVELGRYTHKKGEFINGTSYSKDKVMAYNADLINFCIGRGIDESYFDIIENVPFRKGNELNKEVFKTNTLRLLCLCSESPSKIFSKSLTINLDNSVINTKALSIANIINSKFYCEKLTLKNSRLATKSYRPSEDVPYLYVDKISINAEPLTLLTRTTLYKTTVKANDHNINEIKKAGVHIGVDGAKLYSIDDITPFEKFRKSIHGTLTYIDTKGITDGLELVNYSDTNKDLTLYADSSLIRIGEDGKSFSPKVLELLKKPYEIGFLKQLFNGITSVEFDDSLFNKNTNKKLRNELEEHTFTKELFENSIIEPNQIETAIQNAIGSKAKLTYTQPVTQFLRSNFNEQLIHGKLGYEKNINLFTSYYIHSVMCRMSMRGSEHVPYTTETILLATLLDCLGAKDLNEMITTNRYSVLKQLASGQYLGGFVKVDDRGMIEYTINMNNHLSCYVDYVTSILNDYLDPLALLLSHKNYLLRSNPSGFEISAPYSTQYKPKTIVQDLKRSLPKILDPNQCEKLFEVIGSEINSELTDQLIDLVVSCPDPYMISEEIKAKYTKNALIETSRERERKLESFIENIEDDEKSRLLKRVYSRHLDTLGLSYHSTVYSNYEFKLVTDGFNWGRLADDKPMDQISALTFNSYNESNYEVSFSSLYKSIVALYEFSPLLRVIYDPEDAIEKTFSLIVKGEDDSGFSYTINLESIIREPYYDNPNVKKLLKNKPISRVLPKLDAQGDQVVENGRVVYEDPIMIPYIYNSDDNPIDYEMIKTVLSSNKDHRPKNSRLRDKFRSRISLSDYSVFLDLIYNAYNVFKKRFNTVDSKSIITSRNGDVSVDAVFYDNDGNKYEYKKRQDVLKELGSSHRICIGDKGRTYDLENRRDACEVITVTINGFVTAFLYMSKGLLREVKGSYNTVVGSSASKRINAYGFEFNKNSLEKALDQLKRVSISNIAIVLKSMEMLGIERLIRPFGDARRIYPDDTDALILVSGLIDAPEALNLINQGDTESISESISAISDTYEITYDEALAILNKFYNENNIKNELEASKSLVKRSEFRSGDWK